MNNIEEMTEKIKQSCVTVMVTDLDESKEKKKLQKADFPGAPVVKTLPANARNTGSIPGAGRSHLPGTTKLEHHDY